MNSSFDKLTLSRSPSGYETRIVSHLSYRYRVDIVSPSLSYVRTASHLVTQQQDEALNTAADRTGCISGTSTVVGHVQVCDINTAKGKKELNCYGIKPYSVNYQVLWCAFIPWFLTTVPCRWLGRTDTTDWKGSFRRFVPRWNLMRFCKKFATWRNTVGRCLYLCLSACFIAMRWNKTGNVRRTQHWVCAKPLLLWKINKY